MFARRFARLGLGVALFVVGLGLLGCGDSRREGEGTGVSSAAITPTYGVDYSFARPSPASIVAGGYTFVVRYLSNEAAKNLSASEAQSLEQAGLDIVCNWEDGAMNSLSGYSQGVADAQTADAQAKADGAPVTRPIYFSIDFDEQSSQATTVDSYFDGVASVIGLGRTGAYGGYYAINHLFNAGKITFGWQTYAWSYGSWEARAQLRQIQNGIDNGQEDEDEAMAADFGQWGPGTSPPDWAAAYVSQSFPLASTALPMVEGQTIPSYIELKNVGTKTWDSKTKLGTTQPRDRMSAFADGSWLAPNRLAAVSGTVAPGATYKFEFNLHAPATAGTYKEFFGVVQEGVAWFSDPGQGGPPDDDLEVKVAVTAAVAVDGGVVDDTGPAEDARAGDGASLEGDAAAEPQGDERDGGIEGQPVVLADGGHAPEPAAKHASAGGGCGIANRDGGDMLPFALLGLLLVVRRRKEA